LRLKNTNARHASIARLDRDHGDFHSAYEKMGSPRYPTQAQIQDLQRATGLPDPEDRKLKNGELTITLPTHGLAVIELK
jgi:xylan 1,4-beta-xylosidase